MGNHSLFQGIFPNQGLNPGLLHCRRILYRLSHQASPKLPANSYFFLAGIFSEAQLSPLSPGDSKAQVPGQKSSVSLLAAAARRGGGGFDGPEERGREQAASPTPGSALLCLAAFF